jgi:hypothetical protein
VPLFPLLSHFCVLSLWLTPACLIGEETGNSFQWPVERRESMSHLPGGLEGLQFWVLTYSAANVLGFWNPCQQCSEHTVSQRNLERGRCLPELSQTHCIQWQSYIDWERHSLPRSVSVLIYQTASPASSSSSFFFFLWC